MTDAKRTAAAKKTTAGAPPKKKTPAQKRAAATAAAGEGTGEPTTVEYEGLTLTLPNELPFAFLRYARMEQGPEQALSLLETILGEEQLEQVWDAGLTMSQGLELTGIVMQAIGTSLGESSASANS